MSVSATAMHTTDTFPLIANTYYLDNDALLMARACARGEYQERLVEGTARWSGADLKGKAGKYGGRYAASRDALVAALRAAGLTLIWLRASHGRHVLVVSSETCKVRVEGPVNGERHERLGVVEGHPAQEFGALAVL